MKFKEYLLKKPELEKQKKKKAEEKKMPIMFAGIRSGQKPKDLAEAAASAKKIHGDLSRKGVKDLHSELASHYQFSLPHGKSIHEYTWGSKDLNHHLYEAEKKSLGMKHDTEAIKLPEVHKERLNHIKDALASNTTPKELHVFTGVASDPRKYFDDGSHHTTVRMPAFTSTSLKRDIAENFTHNTGKKPGKYQHHVLRIRVPAGAHAAYVEHHSHHPGEHEVLLHPGAHIKINHQPYHKEWNAFSETHYYDAELVHDGVNK